MSQLQGQGSRFATDQSHSSQEQLLSGVQQGELGENYNLDSLKSGLNQIQMSTERELGRTELTTDIPAPREQHQRQEFNSGAQGDRFGQEPLSVDQFGRSNVQEPLKVDQLEKDERQDFINAIENQREAEGMENRRQVTSGAGEVGSRKIDEQNERNRDFQNEGLQSERRDFETGGNRQRQEPVQVPVGISSNLSNLVESQI